MNELEEFKKMRDPAQSCQKAMTTEAREVFSDRLVRFELDELNGLSDQLAFYAGKRDPGTARCRILTALRCEELLEALSWNRDEVVRLVWNGLKKVPEREEDLVAAALVLRVLGGDRMQYRGWVRGLSVEVRRRLAVTLQGYCSCFRSRKRRLARRTQ